MAASKGSFVETPGHLKNRVSNDKRFETGTLSPQDVKVTNSSIQKSFNEGGPKDESDSNQNEPKGKSKTNQRALGHAPESGKKKVNDETEATDSWYSYLVLAVAFLSCFIIDGINSAYGVIYQDLSTVFSADASSLSWPSAIQTFIMFSGALFTSAFVDVYGLRAAGFIGGLLSAGGFVMAYFSQSLLVFTLSYGFVVGAGFAFMYLSASISVQMHFDKMRPVASGLCYAGSALGVFAMSPLVRFLLGEYSWRGCMLIEAGIVLQCIWLWFLVRPVEEKISKPKEPDNTVDNESSKSKETNNPAGDNCEISGTKETDCQVINEQDKINIHELDVTSSENAINLDMKPSSSQKQTVRSSHNDKETYIKPTISKKMLATLKFSLDFKLLKEFDFTIYIVALFFTQMGFPVMYVFSPDKGTDMGFSNDKTQWFVSCIGIGSLVGRIVAGLIGNLSVLQGRRLHLQRFSVGLAGVSFVLVPACQTFWSMIITLAVFGYATGGLVVLLPVVLFDLFGPDVISRSFGLSLVLIGVASLMSSPLAGFVRDSTKAYDPVFYLAGAFFILAMGIMFLIPASRKNYKTTRTTCRRGKYDVEIAES